MLKDFYIGDFVDSKEAKMEAIEKHAVSAAATDSGSSFCAPKPKASGPTTQYEPLLLLY